LKQLVVVMGELVQHLVELEDLVEADLMRLQEQVLQ
jgi:hypothetical protein